MNTTRFHRRAEHSGDARVEPLRNLGGKRRVRAPREHARRSPCSAHYKQQGANGGSARRCARNPCGRLGWTCSRESGRCKRRIGRRY